MDGEHAFATSGGTAWRRRQRRLRALRRFVLWHSKMDVAAALHHTSRQRTAPTAAATQTMSYAPDPAYSTTAMTTSALIECVAPAPVIADFLEPLVPTAVYAAPAPATEYVKSAPPPETEHVAPALVVTCNSTRHSDQTRVFRT